jgi:hypothetical protein
MAHAGTGAGEQGMRAADEALPSFPGARSTAQADSFGLARFLLSECDGMRAAPHFFIVLIRFDCAPDPAFR